MSEHKETQAAPDKPTSYRSTLIALALVFVVYIGLLCAGLPQKWTAASHAHDHAA
ncbi:MAG: hypothetical protein HUK22_00815, partial [Thermoguttaceae bacterium]|nr:hypothetical protein [Thermoguttaceae bacterium]